MATARQNNKTGERRSNMLFSLGLQGNLHCVVGLYQFRQIEQTKIRRKPNTEIFFFDSG
jgi:hypothetical protein